MPTQINIKSSCQKASEYLYVRVKPKEREAWKEVARPNLSAWIKTMANERVRKR